MDKSEKFWNKQAGGYDKEEMKDLEVRNKILEKIRRYLKKDDHVLDYGCATGILANEIAADVKTVHGIDISHQMIDIAQSKARERNIRNADYSQSTLFDEQHKAGAYDVILGVYLLHLLDDLPAALTRIHELLKPGGLFISVTPCMGRKSLTGIALVILSKIGLIPGLRLFNVSDLERVITDADLGILETECLHPTGRQYFIVARKIGNR